MPERAKPKGILKKTDETDSHKNGRLKWDEDNLMLTEAQKDSKMKIDEPKTPFVYSTGHDDLSDCDDLSSMDLSSAASTSPRSREHVRISPSHSDWESEHDSDSEEAKLKRKRFAELRSKHYNMKEAFPKAQELLRKAEEEIQEEEEDGEDDDDEDDEIVELVVNSDTEPDGNVSDGRSTDDEDGDMLTFQAGNHNDTTHSCTRRMNGKAPE